MDCVSDLLNECVRATFRVTDSLVIGLLALAVFIAALHLSKFHANTKNAPFVLFLAASISVWFLEPILTLITSMQYPSQFLVPEVKVDPSELSQLVSGVAQLDNFRLFSRSFFWINRLTVLVTLLLGLLLVAFRFWLVSNGARGVALRLVLAILPIMTIGLLDAFVFQAPPAEIVYSAGCTMVVYPGLGTVFPPPVYDLATQISNWCTYGLIILYLAGLLLPLFNFRRPH